MPGSCTYTCPLDDLRGYAVYGAPEPGGGPGVGFTCSYNDGTGSAGYFGYCYYDSGTGVMTAQDQDAGNCRLNAPCSSTVSTSSSDMASATPAVSCEYTCPSADNRGFPYVAGSMTQDGDGFDCSYELYGELYTCIYNGLRKYFVNGFGVWCIRDLRLFDDLDERCFIRHCDDQCRRCLFPHVCP
ncbi:hypothetical protein RQP46_010843 [Phenoliferia psychrophenolica]